MTMTTLTKRSKEPGNFLPEDLLQMQESYELVGGRLVERHVGARSSAVALMIAFLIKLYIRGKQLGHAFDAEAGYQCFPDDPKKVRKPDVSFVRRGRLPDDRPPSGHILIPPDLAVEVASPQDKAYELEEKIGDYLAAGVKLIWIVYPSTRRVRVIYPPGSPAGSGIELTTGETITGEQVLPGFSCKVDEFFADD